MTAPAVGENIYFDRQLDELTWGGEPLFLMMAGLLGAKRGVSQVLALSRTDLAFDLAGRELERIGRAGGNNASRATLLRHMAAYVTLCYGLSRTALEEAIEEEQQATKRDATSDAAGLADLLVDLLPGALGEAAPILPDMIGEAACLLALDEGSETVLRAFERERTQVPAAVIRTAQDFAGQERNEDKIVVPLVWLDGLITKGAVENRDLEQIGWQLIDVFRASGNSIALARHAEAVAKKICEVLAEDTKDDLANAKYAKWLVIHGVTQSALGLREKALEDAWQAKGRLYRRLASERPDAFIPDLAGSLNNLANRLSDLGRREDALNAAEEAVSIRRRLASERPDAFIPDLAMSLHTLAIRLLETGKANDALPIISEAIDFRRELCSARPDAFEHWLSTSFWVKAMCLDAVDKSLEARNSNADAISVLRRGFLAHPPSFIHWMKPMCQQYIQRYEALGETPDAELLGPIVEVIQAMEEKE